MSEDREIHEGSLLDLSPKDLYRVLLHYNIDDPMVIDDLIKRHRLREELLLFEDPPGSQTLAEYLIFNEPHIRASLQDYHCAKSLGVSAIPRRWCPDTTNLSGFRSGWNIRATSLPICRRRWRANSGMKSSRDKSAAGVRLLR